jgi:hypothetical protein
MSSKEQPRNPSAPNETRRKLLRAGLYVAPAVIATLMSNDASAGTPPNFACSCAPSGIGNPLKCPGT